MFRMLESAFIVRIGGIPASPAKPVVPIDRQGLTDGRRPHRKPDPELAVREPARHFRFTDEGITNEIVEAAASAPTSSRSPAQEEGEATQLRHRMDPGPHRGEQDRQPHPPTGRHLARRRIPASPRPPPGCLRYWTDPDRETQAVLLPDRGPGDAHLLTEVAKKFGDTWIENDVREANDTSNPGSAASPSRWRPAPARPSSWPC